MLAERVIELARAKVAAREATFGQGLVHFMKSPAFFATLAAPVVAAGANIAQEKWYARKSVREKAQAFQEMTDLHPHFKQRPKEEVTRIYNSLYNIAPQMAKDPTFAGAWVDQVIETKTPGYNTHQSLIPAVKDLASVEKTIGDIKGRGPEQWGATAMAVVPGLIHAYDDELRNGVKVQREALKGEEREMSKTRAQQRYDLNRLRDQHAKALEADNAAFERKQNIAVQNYNRQRDKDIAEVQRTLATAQRLNDQAMRADSSARSRDDSLSNKTRAQQLAAQEARFEQKKLREMRGNKFASAAGLTLGDMLRAMRV